MKFEVKAERMGYYDHRRYREGEVFLMDEADLVKKSQVKDEEKLEKNKARIVKGQMGEYILPSWVELHGDNTPKQKPSFKEKQMDANKDVL